MGRKKKSDIAAEADWGFLQKPWAIEAVDYASRRAARVYDGVEYEDCYQDLLLWLSVRPERVDEEEGLLGVRLYGVLKDRLDREALAVPTDFTKENV